MIGRLHGTLLEKHPPSLLVDVQGVAYEVDAPMSTFYQLPQTGQAVTLHTHLVVRDDAHLLFGFATQVERRFFRLLLKVNGVGAKVALSILSGMSPDEFAVSVASKEVAALTRIPGIGKKTAERLLVELQDKIDAPVTGSSPATSTPSNAPASPSIRAQAEQALEALGYKPAEIKRLLDAAKGALADDDALSVEAWIRAALRSTQRN